MESKTNELLETSTTMAKSEAMSTNTSPIESDTPKMESEVKDQEKRVEYITGLRLYLVLFGVTCVMFLVMLDQTVVVTAIPKISGQFDSIKDIGWYGCAYLLTTSSLQPLTGKIFQYYSSKVVFLSCLVIFELGSLICGVAQSSVMLIVGRAIAGLGGAGLMTGVITILAASAPPSKRPALMGITMAFSSIELVAGPIIGGVFTQYATWRWCFFVNLPFGAISTVLIFFIQIPKYQTQISAKGTIKEQLQRLDLPGFVLFVPAVIMFLLALEWGGVIYAWNSATIIGLFCGSAGAFVVFSLIERRAGDEAMLPVAVVLKREVVCAGIVTLLSSGGGLLVAYYLPIWFQVLQGTTPIIGGVHILPTIGGLVVGAATAGKLVSQIGYSTPFAIIGCILSAIGSGLLVTLTPYSSAGMWVGYQVVTGLGRGFIMRESLTAVQAALPPAMLPIGTAFITFVQLLGGTLFIPIGETMFTNQLRTALSQFAPNIDVELLLAAGATAFRIVVTPSEVPGVLLAYNQALTRIFYLGVGAGCVSAIASFGMGWTNIKTLDLKEPASKEASSDQV